LLALIDEGSASKLAAARGLHHHAGSG